MNAGLLLRDLGLRGITVQADGAQLVVDGPARELSEGLLVRLRLAKADLLSALQARKVSKWDGKDWQAYFDERAAVREYEGELPRPEAERLAFIDTAEHWLRLNPPAPSDPAQGCVHCGLAGQKGELLPVLAAGGHTWIHDHCLSSWARDRTADASAALGRVASTEVKRPHASEVVWSGSPYRNSMCLSSQRVEPLGGARDV